MSLDVEEDSSAYICKMMQADRMTDGGRSPCVVCGCQTYHPWSICREPITPALRLFVMSAVLTLRLL